MPILVKEQDWTQTNDTVEISVPLKGHSKADVYCKHCCVNSSEFSVPKG